MHRLGVLDIEACTWSWGPFRRPRRPSPRTGCSTRSPSWSGGWTATRRPRHTSSVGNSRLVRLDVFMLLILRVKGHLMYCTFGSKLSHGQVYIWETTQLSYRHTQNYLLKKLPPRVGFFIFGKIKPTSTGKGWQYKKLLFLTGHGKIFAF